MSAVDMDSTPILAAPVPGVAEQVLTAFKEILRAFGAWCDHDPWKRRVPEYVETSATLRRLFDRFRALLALSLAGLLPRTRAFHGRVPVPVPVPGPGERKPRPALLVARGFGWLTHLASGWVGGRGLSVMAFVLAKPEVVTLVQGSAEARAILRRLHWAFGIRLPGLLVQAEAGWRAARAPRRKRARRVRKPKAEQAGGPPPGWQPPPEPVSRYWNTGRPFGYLGGANIEPPPSRIPLGFGKG